MTTDATIETTTPFKCNLTEDDLEDFKLFENNTRYIFLGVFITVTILSLCGNLTSIYFISKRSYRRFQKTCTISLALSDILSTIVIAMINISGFTNKYKFWTLGSFLCKFLPVSQMAGIWASSLILMVIAVDRYRNVIYALSKRWNPRLCFCLLGLLIILVISFGVSSPLYTYFKQMEYTSMNGKSYYMCMMASPKDVYATYHLVMVAIIFLPLFFVFIWSYYNIAVLVWRHRKPVFAKKNLEEKSSTSSRTLPEMKNVNKPKTQDDIRVERKMRTFKIIVALMIVFILCRLPYFAIQILKITDVKISSEQYMWYLHYGSMALHTVSCILNPLLYTFLHFTLKVLDKVKTFISEVLCFCCSDADFESFGKENPFLVENNYEMKRNSKVRFEDEGKF